MIKWFKNKISQLDHIQIRYNTNNNGGPLVWRVIINDVEYLAEDILIIGYCYGERSFVNGERKLNISCKGRASWSGNRVEIITDTYRRELI